jgi:hypothetical protein
MDTGTTHRTAAAGETQYQESSILMLMHPGGERRAPALTTTERAPGVPGQNLN